MTEPGASDPVPWRVVAGRPTDEEVAALVVVLGRPAVGPDPEPQPASADGWSAYWRRIGAPLVPGPGAWRSSGRLG